MRVHQLDADGVIINTIVVESSDFMSGLVDAEIGGKIGDRVVNGTLYPATPDRVVPESVTRRQARQALLLQGLLDRVQPALDAIPDPLHRNMAQIEWMDSLNFERRRPMLIQIGHVLGLDDAGLDDLFIQAAKL